jgi:predicted phosphodiesterase
VTIVFIGDIHQQWDCVTRGLAALERHPRAAILLGDIQCDQPLDRLAAPLLDRGIAVHWIFGNHDNDGGPEMWANLAEPARNPRTAAGALHARVTNIDGVRIAGLGGTFRPLVWDPPAPPRLYRRAELPDDLARTGLSWRQDHLAAMVHSLGSAAIWPEDYDALAAQSADVLVTHEAPASHPAGRAALDALARAMGARLIVHGHHHVSYRAVATDGLRAMGVAAAWGADPEGTVLWRGETQRHLPPPPDGWSHEAEASAR